jgi:hypothetical protein
MKKFAVSILILLFNSSWKLCAQINVSHTLDLMGKSFDSARTLLTYQIYGYVEDKDGYSDFTYTSTDGVYDLRMFLKNDRVGGLMVMQNANDLPAIIADLGYNNFQYKPLGSQPAVPAPQAGSIYKYLNADSTIMCCVVFPINYNYTNSIWLNYSYNVKKVIINPPFQGTRKFTDGDGWEYQVSILKNSITLKLFPTANNEYHKRTKIPFKTITGYFKGRKIITTQSKFKIENDSLYELNNEGGWNEYRQLIN